MKVKLSKHKKIINKSKEDKIINKKNVVINNKEGYSRNILELLIKKLDEKIVKIDINININILQNIIFCVQE
jgi:hypothetical protein